MIRVRQYTPSQIKLFGPNDEFIDFINNQTEFLRVRIDIGTQQLDGYYCMFGLEKIVIKPNGMLEKELPSGMNWHETNKTLGRLMILFYK